MVRPCFNKIAKRSGTFTNIILCHGHVPGFFPKFIEQLFCKYLQTVAFVFGKAYESLHQLIDQKCFL